MVRTCTIFAMYGIASMADWRDEGESLLQRKINHQNIEDRSEALLSETDVGGRRFEAAHERWLEGITNGGWLEGITDQAKHDDGSLLETNHTPGALCTTNGSPEVGHSKLGSPTLYPNEKCVQSFVYAGVRITGCTYIDAFEPWCMVQSSSHHRHRYWKQRGVEIFHYGICDKATYKTCGEPHAQPKTIVFGEGGSRSDEVRTACLQRIDYCLWSKPKFGFTEKEIRRQFNCMHEFCDIAFPGNGNRHKRRNRCQKKLITFGREMNFTDATHSPMGYFCEKAAELASDGLTIPQLELMQDANLTTIPHLELMQDANKQYEQRLLLSARNSPLEDSLTPKEC